MEPSAKVILDSISPDGYRLTTLEVVYHRFVLAEFNTHRVFCLSGDTKLWFRLPSDGRLHKMTIRKFYDKWHNGAAPRPNKSIRSDLGTLDKETHFSMKEAAQLLGYENATNLNRYCREGRITAYKLDRTWYASGDSIMLGVKGSGFNQQDVKWRLQNMLIDQACEDDFSLGATTITDVIYSGRKTVYELSAGGHKIRCSADHLFLTRNGWKRLAEFVDDETVLVVQRGKPKTEHHGDRFKRIEGRWISQWVRSVKSQLSNACSCGEMAIDAHHLIPVHERPDLAFEITNLVSVCKSCHNQHHEKQGWQQGVPNYLDFVPIDGIELIGEEDTYDLSVAGIFPNFVADGFVVHNSRNSASSRAIPVEKQLKNVLESPAWPLKWPCEQPGMQGGDELTGEALADAGQLFYDVWDCVTDIVDEYVEGHPEKSERLHKSLINRLLEPFMWHTVIVTANSWDGFFDQRCSPLAQPEIEAPARLMREAIRRSTPTFVDWDEYHMPYISEQDLYECAERDLDPKRVSVARCARVSHLTHDGVRDLEQDVNLFSRLESADPVHASPFEHVACPAGKHQTPLGNFRGWHQLRHQLLGV